MLHQAMLLVRAEHGSGAARLPAGLEERCYEAVRRQPTESHFQRMVHSALAEVLRGRGLAVEREYCLPGSTISVDAALPGLRIAVEAGEPAALHAPAVSTCCG